MSDIFPLLQDGKLRPFIKVLTDYPRDDLASDEVHQALITECAKEKLDCFACDVGSVYGMDTVMAAFKTAQLSLNSDLGFGHVFLTNCAPRKNIISSRSKGEGVVIGILPNGVAVLTVNSGYALAPFAEMIRNKEIYFFESKIPDEGSQFRSRDYFPAAAVKLASFLSDRLNDIGVDAVSDMINEGVTHKILDGFFLQGAAIEAGSVSEMPLGCIWYIDNFGNIKLNIKHSDLSEIYEAGESLVVAVGDAVADAVMGSKGFSQGEGILALTCGSSGWSNNADGRFTEVFLRGGSAKEKLSGAVSGEQVYVLSKDNLKTAQKMLRDADVQYIGTHNLFMLSEARLIQVFSHYGLIKNGYDSSLLREKLANNSLIDFFLGYSDNKYAV